MRLTSFVGEFRLRGLFFVLLKWLEQADRFDAPLIEHFGDEVGEDFALFRWCWAGLKSVADGSEILDRR
ncbi:hypothetical protein [Schaalia cardiffensis]|uniref:hypothetical protein n=1 Tax=Schaalia cardiffensis TaxID=181487 RepID=UPI002AB2241B|nr:hypothetical protein [Schaalia cardiffensis]